jgi:hypothetical protein
MLKLSNEEKLKLVQAFSLAPSAHNVQPLKWQFLDQEDTILIHTDLSRMLPIADAHHRDLFLSLGAALLGMEINLLSYGLSISSHELISDMHQYRNLEQKTVPLLKVKLIDAEKKVHPLTPALEKRFTFRGILKKISTPTDEKLKNWIKSNEDIFLVGDKKSIKEVSKVFDATTFHFITKPGYLAELYQWIRFAPSHSKWNNDGMNAVSLALSSIEAFFAKYILKTKVFELFRKVGLGAIITSESPKVNSSSYLLAIVGEDNKDYIQHGKIFYQRWLELSELGLYGSPLSLMADLESSREFALKLFGAPKGSDLINILRVGQLPENYTLPERARLDPHSLWLK